MFLGLNGNQIASLNRKSILPSLDADKTIDLSGNPLPQEELDAFEAATPYYDQVDRTRHSMQMPSDHMPIDWAIRHLNAAQRMPGNNLLLPDLTHFTSREIDESNEELVRLRDNALHAIKEAGVSYPGAKLTLSNIDKLLAQPTAEPAVDYGDDMDFFNALKSARLEFVNNVLIPHLDYFVIQALSKMPTPETIEWAE